MRRTRSKFGKQNMARPLSQKSMVNLIRMPIDFAVDTCNVALATHMRSYGETEEHDMHRLRMIYVNLWNFKRYVSLYLFVRESVS